MKELKTLNKYIFKYKWRLLLGILFIIASNYFLALMPEVVKNTVNKIENYNPENNSIDLWNLGLYAAFLYFSFALIKGVFLFLTRQTIIIMSRLIEYDLKNTIYEKYQSLSLDFYKRNSTGDLMNRIAEDVSKVRMYLGPALMYSINVVVLFIMVISFMLNVNVKLTFYVLTPLPIMSVLIFFVSSVINKKSEITQKRQSKLSTFVQEAFSGIRVLKAYNREKYFDDMFEEETENYRIASLSLAITNAWFQPIIVFLIGISTILTIYVGGLDVINGKIDIGDIIQFVFYINMLTWPFASIGWVSSLVQRAAASQKRINEFLNEKPTITSEKNNDFTGGTLTFNNITFQYPESGIIALDNVSFEIEKGKTLAITGKTGSGKSTIAALVNRFFDPQKGTVSINKNNLKDFNITKLRKNIGYVPQDDFLFSESIKNNIAFGFQNGEFDEDAIFKAADQSDVYQNIMDLPEQFDTIVGERGVTLSGGQKQRIAIARAIVEPPEILIFDDCLSAVDTKTEEKILQNLKEITKDRTTIIIGHRISSLKHADKIIVLDDGKIIEEGNHEKLLQNGNFYAQTFEKQQLNSD